jgi:putative aldouronate transport system permease protein
MRETAVGARIFDAANVAFLVLFSCSILYPFVYIFSLSVSDPLAISRGQVNFLPVGFQLNAYRNIISASLGRAYLNTVYYSVVGTFMILFFSVLGAYPLSRPRLRGKAFFTVVFTITMFFGGGLIPNFFLIKGLGMLDTVLAISLPGAFGFWNIIILRTNFQQLPESLSESAYMDGANDWLILRKIVLPLSKPILATVTLWSVIRMWNNYFGPLIYLPSPSKEPLTIFLRRVLVSRFVDDLTSVSRTLASRGSEASLMKEGLMRAMRMATILVTIGPIILVYPFIQKYFVKGTLIGSIKG